MGNFHCVPDGCGRVVYREYLPGVIRWRYPNEEWNEIEGDNFTLESNFEIRDDFLAAYWIEASGTVENRVPADTNKPAIYEAGQTITIKKTSSIFLSSFEVNFIDVSGYWNVEYTSAYTLSKTCYSRKTHSRLEPQTRTSGNSSSEPVALNIKLVRFVEDTAKGRQNCTRKSDNCIFTIYSQEKIVHQQSSKLCPEVEQLPLRLSDEVKEIKIEKLSYLEAIEIANFARDTIFTVEIPRHCLNIYLTFLQSSIIPFFDIYPDYKFIAQICSAVGCPPPEYQIICDCDCEECPDSTCAIECGNVICCYNTEGRSIKSIPIENYCGGTS